MNHTSLKLRIAGKLCLLVSLLLIPGSMFGMLSRTARLRTALRRVMPKTRQLMRRSVPMMQRRLNSTAANENVYSWNYDEKVKRAERLKLLAEGSLDKYLKQVELEDDYNRFILACAKKEREKAEYINQLQELESDNYKWSEAKKAVLSFAPIIFFALGDLETAFFFGTGSAIYSGCKVHNILNMKQNIAGILKEIDVCDEAIKGHNTSISRLSKELEETRNELNTNKDA